MRFSFNTSSTEIRFHCPGVLRPIFEKRKISKGLRLRRNCLKQQRGRLCSILSRTTGATIFSD
jgi:hypothetical protein